jgi:hypothetical protein
MKGLSRLIITLATYLLTTTDAFAAVNMKNASFISEWTDYRVNHWDLIRTYDSRSTHNGLFGYGWCSGLDVRLKINAIAGDPTEVSIQTHSTWTLSLSGSERVHIPTSSR